MKKHYKLWIVIEEIDEDTDTYRDLCDDGEVLPVPVGVYESLDDAGNAAEAHATDNERETNETDKRTSQVA